MKWIKNSEKNSKYFLNLEKHHKTLNVIRELKSNKEKKINKNYIVGEMVNFYTSLYTSKNIPNEKLTNIYQT